MSIIERVRTLNARVEGWLGMVPIWFVLLLLRVALAVPFLRSGMTKWEGLGVSPSTLFLFRQEFKLHLPGGPYAYPFPDLMALGAAVGEIVLPLLLIAGLFTRYSALGILVMTAIIQLTVPGAWANFHLPWAAMAIALMAMGGGSISLDGVMARGSMPPARR